MPYVLPTSANETIGEESANYYLVFYNAFALFALSAEMLLNALWHRPEEKIYCLRA